MDNKSSMSRVERLHREKVTRYSIRKYSFGAASVAVAALFMFLGNGAVSANELSKQDTPSVEAPAPASEDKPNSVENTPTVQAISEESTAKPAEAVTPALNKTQLESYISEIETKLSNGSYDNKTEESVAELKADLEAAKATLANATTQEEIKKAYSKLVTTANTKLKAKPVEKKVTPAVDTTNGKETVGKKAENTEKNPESNSIENTGSNDPRNRQAIPTGIQFRAEVAYSEGTNAEPNGHSDTYILNDVNKYTSKADAVNVVSRVTNYKVKYNKDNSGKITSLDWLVFYNDHAENLANVYNTDGGDVYRNFIQIPAEVNMPKAITRAKYASPINGKLNPKTKRLERIKPDGSALSSSVTFENPSPNTAAGLPRAQKDTFALASGWESDIYGRAIEKLAGQEDRYFKSAASDSSPKTKELLNNAVLNDKRLIVDRSTTGGNGYDAYAWSFRTEVPKTTTNEQIKDMKVVFGMMRSATAGANAAFANIATNPIKMWKSDVYTPTAKDQTVKAGQQPTAEKSIGNFNTLPQGTTVKYKDTVDTQNSGEKPAIAVVTYPDTSKKEVPVKVIVEKEAVAVAAPVVNTNAKARNTVLSTDEELTGTGTPGATVKVTVKNPEGTTVISEKTTQVGADGNWKLGLDKGLNSNEILGGNAAPNTFYAPKNKVEVTQVVNGVSSAATAVTVSEGASTILPSAAAKDGKSVVAGAKEVTVTIPHDAGIAYFWYTNKNDNSKPQIDIKREADGNFVISGNNAGKATVKNVVKGAFSDTVTLTLTEPAKEGANLEIIPHNGLATKGTYLGRANIPVTNEKPVVSSATNSDVTTVNVGGTVNLSTLAKVTDHEDDQNATLGTKGTPTVVSINGDTSKTTLEAADLATSGTYVVKYKAVDSQGKESNEYEHTVKVNQAPTVELPYSNPDKKQIYVYTGEKTDLTFKASDDTTVKDLYLRNKDLDESDNASVYGFTIGKVTDSAVASGEGTVSDDKKIATIKMVGVTNLRAGQKWTSFIEAKDNDGVKSMPANEAYNVENNYELRRRKLGYVEFIVKSQTDKYDIKTPTEKVAVTDPANVTEADLAKVKEKLQLEYNQDNDDANIAKDTAVDKNGKIQSVTKDGNNLVVTYTDGSTDTKPLSEFVTLDKEPAIDAVKKAAEAKIAEINKTPNATDDEKQAAINKVNADKKKALDEIAKPEVTTKDALDKAQTAGTDAIAKDNPVVAKKDEAKKAIDDALKAKEAAIAARPDLTDDEKKAAKDAAKAAADKAKGAVDAATTNAAVDKAKEDGTTAVANVTPVAKAEAKKAIAKALEAKNSEIDKRTDLTDEEKTAAKKEAKDKADAQLAKINEQPDAAATPTAAKTAQDAVDTAKKSGVDEVAAVNPEAVTKPAAKKAIEDKLAKQLEEIANTPDATDEEKKVAEDAAKAAAEKAKEEIDKAETDAAVEAKKDEAVGKDGAKGTIDKLPVVEDKPNARKAIEDEAKAKKEAIDARQDLTPEAKEVLKAKVDKIAKKAKEGIDAVTSKTDVDVIKEADKEAIKAIGEVNRPIDKVLVKDPSALTDEEKAKILEEVKKVNPTAKEVKYDDNGKIEVTTEAGDKGTINPTKLVKTEEQLDNGKGGNDINKPLDKVIVKDPSKLTDEEKAKIVAEVEEVNPDAIVTIDENGTVSVSTPDGKTAAIPASDLVRTKEDTAKPDAGNSKIVKPADKVVGEANDPDDQAKVEAKLRELNPETKSVKFDENGNATVTLNDGTTATIPSEDLFRSEADVTKPNAGNDIVKPADKTVVANPEKLTDAEKKAIEDKVKAVNPDATVVVDDKGNATVTTPEGKTAVIPATDLTKSPEAATKPNAGNDIVKPADKTAVKDPANLTPEEKKAIEDKVKAVNPDATVVVDDKGNATVTTPAGNTAVIPATDLIKDPEAATKPNAGNDIVKPADKTVVANPEKLTDAEKKAIEDKVKAVNPGATVVVDDKGNATVTTPAGNTAVIPAADLTKDPEAATKPNAGNDVVKPADKTEVANPDKLTDAEKKAIEDKVKAVNPDATVVVDDKGNATVTTPAGNTAVIPAADLTKSSEDAAKPNAGNDVVKPADKTEVANPDKLTDAEKKAIEDKVKAVNPGATVVVDDKGNATVTTPAGNTAVIPATDLTKDPEAATKPNAGNDIVKPADKTEVANPDKLTDAEKKAIEDKVKAVNPDATVVVDDKGNATVTTPEGKTAVIPAADLTKDPEAATKPNAGNDIVKPADKTEVANPDKLTDAEKKAIEDKVKAVNPGATVVVDDKGNATVTTPAGNTAVIPAADLTKSSEDAAKPNAGNDVVKPADKTEVANPDKLTDAEKKAIEDKVKAVNPDATVVVDDKGNATVTTPAGNTAVIPATDLTKSPEDAAKPNAGNDVVKPADKTEVANPDKLTDAEKKAIEDKVKAVNPGATVVVDDKGNATVTTPAGNTAVIPATDLTKDPEAATKPNAGNDIVKPADKTVVANPEKLTDAEKKAIEDKVKAVNPDATVVVDDKGNATVTTPEGKTAVIPAADLTKDPEAATKPNAGNDIVKPADKTEVANPDKLTDAEKKAIEDKVKAVNPDATVVVDDKGNATVTTPAGNTAVIPATDLTKDPEAATKPNAGNDIVKPADKTEVANPDKLTDAEKKAIEDKVKAVNPGATVVVDDKGNATVTTPAGNTAVIPATDLTKDPEAATKPNAGNDIVKPADKTEVANPDKLTDAEKKAIEDKVKAVNPDATVVVDDKGNATVTTPEGKTAVIPAADVTKSAADAGKANAGNAVNTPAAKVEVKDPAKLIDEEKAKVKEAIEAVNPGSKVVVDDKGNATVTTPEGNTAVIPAADLTKSAADAGKANAGNAVNTPATRVLVGDKAKLTADEIEKVKESIKAVNPGATVVVDENGNATVTTPEGKTATIPAAQLVKDAKDVAAKNNGENINVDFEKEIVADFNNLTDAEKEAAKAKIKGANADVREVIFDKAGNATVITKDGKVYTIAAKDIFKQRLYVPSNGGGNNGATNTDAKVDKAKLEGAIHQLDELIIKESAKLDAETAKEANALSADAKKVFANADASQAEVDAMVKRIEDFMAKVSPSTDHATPATAQAAANAGQTASAQANARKAAKELPNTGTADSTVAMVAAAASAVLGLGLAGRRRKEDEEA